MSDLILVSREDPIAILQLNRPDVLNAISMEVLTGLATLCEELDADESIRCIVITGSEKAFAAGSDIKGNFAGKGVIELHQLDFPRQWARFPRIKTPLVAAVSGYCLGGGCELAMCCDIILASETAQFAQPEVNIGIMTGAGASQRLTRAVGKYVANDMILTGRYVKADEARAIGLAARVFPAATFMEDVRGVARTIASKAPLAVQLASELVDAAQSMPLDAGLLYERRAFTLLFASEDKTEGVDAFIQKRTPVFKGR